MRRLLFIIASLLVSALFLWLALRNVPLAEVAANLGRADVGWLAITLLILAITLWTRAVRWRGLLGWRISLMEAFHIVNISFLMNQLPLRAGEVARSLLAGRVGVPVFTAAASILVERLLDTLFVVLLLALSLANLPSAPPIAAQTASIFGVLAVVGLGLLLVFARYPHWARALLAFMERLLPILRRLPLGRLLEHILDGLQTLTNPRQAAHTLFWTGVAWGMSWVSFYTMHRALGITDIDLWLSAAISLSLASFSIALPLSMAALGPFEAAIKLTGDMMGIEPSLSAALGFLAHGMTVFAYIIGGTIGLVRLGVSLGEVTGRQQAE